MKRFIFILPIIISIQGYPQQITLNDCLISATDNHVLNNEAKNNESIHNLNKKNLNSKWLPELNIQAQASYQDPVMNLSLPVGNIEINQPNDQYKTWLDIKQNIYDGGIIQKSKKIEIQTEKIDQVNTEIKIYDIKKTVTDLYFNVLILQTQKKQMQLLKQELDERLNNINSLIKAGAALKSNADALIAEHLKLSQQIIEINMNISSLKQVLSIYTGINMNDSCLLIIPVLIYNSDTTNNRLEYNLFSTQLEQFTLYKSLQQSALYPKIYGFAQIGYGKPGLNMLSDEFDNYYIIGAGLSWTIFDWNQTRHNKQITELQKSNVQVAKDNFDKNLSAATEQAKTKIFLQKQLLESDNEIIDAYSQIASTARSQFDNGTINSVDLITELNKERTAIINNEIHKIKYAQAIAEYYILTGNL